MDTKLIGNKIAEARKRIKISQAELAQRLFISPQAVGKWERGESIPDIFTFNRLAEILGVDLNYFSDTFSSGATATAEAPSAARQPATPLTGKEDDKPGWDMSGGNWVDADFSGLKNLHEKFAYANMRNCKFIGAEMSGLLLKSNMIDGCDFSRSDMNGSQIQHAHLTGNRFTDCSLQAAAFSDTHIKGCNFSGADLTGAIFRSCALQKSVMEEAVLNRTAFNNTSFADLIFQGRLEDCSFDNCGFSRVTFRNTILVNTFFKGRSLKQITFIDCQTDRMTYEFLKNGKANLNGITLLTT
ncbi:pentapeptide repeat-containing protein [Chitinophaga solisilvae]|uniref:pentapeptide repeat-containing protein n=1 Tax=Chitinophaga solisilvae TaxID=1233460 RepID=UPI00192105F2|nr:pentapeptide repeat-containing protein [Chitinophaga solisilvae]